MAISFLPFDSSRIRRLASTTAALVLCSLAACTPPFDSSPKPGPDKQGTGTWYGAAMGAGTGAVTGAQLSAGAGPGAVVGAGFGAIWGMIQGIGVDALEDDLMRREDEQQCLKERAWVQEVLAQHYSRRVALHPNRDLFPADLFFSGDSPKLKPRSDLLVREIARMTKGRMPWSRIMVVAYVTAPRDSSEYAQTLSGVRAQELALYFVKGGIEPRRVLAKGIVVKEPVVIDPLDAPGRYRQAIEIVALDR